MNYLYFICIFPPLFFTVSPFSSPKSRSPDPRLPARDRFGDPILWDPFRDSGSLRSSCQCLFFAPQNSHFFSPVFPFFAGFPYFGCYNFGISPLSRPSRIQRDPGSHPSSIPGLPALAHPGDISGITRGVPKEFFFSREFGVFFFLFPGRFGLGSAGIPWNSLEFPKLPPCQVTVLESRGAFRGSARLCPAPFPLPSVFRDSPGFFHGFLAPSRLSPGAALGEFAVKNKTTTKKRDLGSFFWDRGCFSRGFLGRGDPGPGVG